MKPFIFSLHRMRSYKKQVLNKEKHTLVQLQHNKSQLEEKIEALDKERVEIGKELSHRQKQGLKTFQIASFQFLLDNTQQQIKDLQKQLIIAQEEVDRQMNIVICGSQELSGLDKLEEKQFEEYQVQLTKDQETELSEQIIMRKKKNMFQLD